MKKFYLFIFIVALGAGAGTARAQEDNYYDHTDGTLYYKINAGEGHTVSVVTPYANGWEDGEEEEKGLSMNNSIDKPTGAVTIPRSVTICDTEYTVSAIADGVFQSCTGITSVTFSSDCSSISIGNNAFNTCTQMTSVDLNGVTSIGEYAFSGCPSLNSVTLPSSVVTINIGAFSSCIGLTSFVCESSSAPTVGFWIFGTANTSLVIQVPFGSNYSTTTHWSDYSSHMRSNLEDATAYSSENTSSGVQVQYTRTFPTSTWVPLFVPFSSSVSEWGEGFTIAKLNSVNIENGSDVLHWQTLSCTATVEANTPYIIKYTGTAFEHTFTDCNIASSTIPAFTPINNGGTGENARNYSLIGTYEEMDGEVLTDADAYCMGGGNFHHATSSNALHAQRFYLTITDPSTGYTAPAPASMCVMVDNEVVGILEHIFEPELLIDDNYYDVLGRRIDNPQAGQLYIHQGKKIIYSDQPTIDY